MKILVIISLFYFFISCSLQNDTTKKYKLINTKQLTENGIGDLLFAEIKNIK